MYRVAAAFRARRPGAGRRPEPDSGFLLLESVIAMTVITVVMTALTSLLISSTHSTSRQRDAQVASRLASAALDKAYSLGAELALKGRDQTSSQNQRTASPPSPSAPAGLPAVASWLQQTQVAWDPDAQPGDGANAALRTVPVPSTVNGNKFQTSYFVGYCWKASNASGDCVAQDLGATATEYVAVVVAVAWHGSGCPAAGCAYASEILLNGSQDPTFNFDQKAPTDPVLARPPNQTSVVGQPVNGLTGMVGCASPCPFSASDGTPSYVFSVADSDGDSTLPPGLDLDPATGLVTGTPTTTGTYHVQLSVTDAFRNTDALGAQPPWFTWTVTNGPLSFTQPPDQSNVAGDAVDLAMTGASGGEQPYVWSATGLPPGLSINAGTGVISGTPTSCPGATRTCAVTVTLADGADTDPVSRSFDWKVTPGLSVAAPAPIPVTWTGGTVTTTAAFNCPNAPCTFSISGQPAGIAITGQPTGSSGSLTLSGTVTAPAGNYPTVLTITDKTGVTKHTAPFTWPVTAAPTPPTITDPGSQYSDWSWRKDYHLQLRSSCPAEGCTFSVTARQWHDSSGGGWWGGGWWGGGWWGSTDDVSVDGAGKLTVSSPEQTQYEITVTITDSTGAQASIKFYWTFR